MKKAIVLAILAMLAGMGTVLGLAGSAGADTTSKTGYIKQYAVSYTSPSEHSYIVHKGLQPNTPVETLCVREGQGDRQQHHPVHDHEGRRHRLRPPERDLRADRHAPLLTRCAGGYSNSPRRIASATAAARSETPSFS